MKRQNPVEVTLATAGAKTQSTSSGLVLPASLSCSAWSTLLLFLAFPTVAKVLLTARGLQPTQLDPAEVIHAAEINEDHQMRTEVFI